MEMSVYLPKFTIEAEFSKPQNNPFTSTSIQRLHPKGISSHGFKRAWDAGFTGKGIIVAILDTGVDSSHPDLKDKVIKSIDLTGESISESHGTHVAGTIAANGWLVGGAPDASILDIKVLGRSGGSVSNIVKAISLAIDNGAAIINMSLGSKNLSSEDILQLTNAINNAWTKGVICIAAAGNDGTSICTPDPYQYPASVNKAESVAACDVGENLDTISLSSFSNENNRVDLAACGHNVISTIIGGKYGIYSGTSMATPHVSAMAAILAQYIRNKYPDLKGSTFCSSLVSMIHLHVRKMDSCGIKSNISIRGKTLLIHSIDTACVNVRSITSPTNPLVSTYSNISFGVGFMRYEPDSGPVSPQGEKYYNNNIFLGHQITQ